MNLTYRTGHTVRNGDTFTAAPLHGELGQPRWRDYFITEITDEGVSCTELVSDLNNPLRTFSGLTQETMGAAEIICCRNEEYKGPLDLSRLQLETMVFSDHYFGRAYLMASGTDLAKIVFGVSQPEAHANRIAACVNSCIGLDLPEDCPPGILAELVTAVRTIVDFTANRDVIDSAEVRIREILAKLAPVGSPDNGKSVSPPEPEKVPLIAGFTLFRSREDLDAYYKELNEMGEGGGPSGEPYEPPVDRPDFPFFGRQILDDNGWPEDFQTIGGEEAYAMAQALDSNVTRF